MKWYWWIVWAAICTAVATLLGVFWLHGGTDLTSTLLFVAVFGVGALVLIALDVLKPRRAQHRPK